MMALIANVNRDPKRRPQPWKPENFDPCTEKSGAGPVVITRANIGDLRAMFPTKGQKA